LGIEKGAADVVVGTRSSSSELVQLAGFSFAGVVELSGRTKNY